MTTPGSIYRPYDKLVRIRVLDCEFDVPEKNPMLRALQSIAPEQIAYGRFCWNEDCQECRISYDLGDGTPAKAALACKLITREGMRILEMSRELRYCLRGLGLSFPSAKPIESNSNE